MSISSLSDLPFLSPLFYAFSPLEISGISFLLLMLQA
jgi:hypothetical protein